MPDNMTKPDDHPRSTIDGSFSAPRAPRLDLLHDLRPTIHAPQSAIHDPQTTVQLLCTLFLTLTLLPLPPAHAQAPAFIRGGDLSSLYRLEQSGAVFNNDGESAPAMEILRDTGMNLVRLRLWHTPAGGVNGLEETLAALDEALEKITADGGTAAPSA